MSAIALLLVGLGAMALGYVFYSKFIAERIYRLDPNYRTPAHTMRDGVDYVPTNKLCSGATTSPRWPAPRPSSARPSR